MRRVVGVALAAITATVLAGCGGATVSSSDQGGSGGAAAPGVTADTITLGMVTPMSGNFAALGTDGQAGADALIQTVNAAGGIHGRKLALAVQDDQYDPKQAVAGARYFTTQQQVLGIWGNNGTATTLAGMPTLQAAGVPLLFPMALSTQLSTYDRSFASMLPLSAQFQLLSDHAASQPDLAAGKWGILYQNDGTSSEVADGFKKGKTALASNVSFERTATSYAPQLQKLQADGVTDLVFIGNVNQISVALKEADQVGYKPQWYSSLGNTSPDLAKLTGPLAEGVITVNPYAPPQSDLPGTNEFRAAMDRYEPGKSQSMYALNSWVGGKIIVDALQRAGKDLNRDSFLAALQQTKGLEIGGIMPPITITAQDRTASTCIVLAAVTQGVFRASGAPVCQ